MIFYLVTQRGYGATVYPASWGPTPDSRMRYVLYDELPSMSRLERGTYVFTDHERLAPAELELAREVWATLGAAKPPIRRLNDPSKTLGRLELLRRLFDAGVNRFRAVRASERAESLASLRYPVFVREEMAHRGTLTPLIRQPEELFRVLRRLPLEGYYRKDLLVVEFCDTADAAGIYRKYSSFRVAGKILPRHALFSRRWEVKTSDLDDPSLTAERNEYLTTNPHEAQIAKIFDLAGLDFGRIDYSVLDGALQVWEINSNPTVRSLTPRLTACFDELDDVTTTGPADAGMPWSVRADLVRALERTRRVRFLTRKHREIAERVRNTLRLG